jgi:5-methylcytosine-specific restriction enzyme subunit McrC
MAKRSDLGRLSEGQVLTDVDLTLGEAIALAATQLVNVAPGPTTGWTVTAAHAVGALRCGDLAVRVAPKVGQIQVLRLLARAYGLKGLVIDESLVGVEADPDLTSVLAALFAREAAGALVGGPLRGYRTEDQSLNVLRGRLRLRDQELKRFGQLMPLEVTVDEWTADTDDNRRIRAATHRLLAQPGLTETVQRSLVHVDRLLADVWLAPRGAHVAPWIPTRLNLRLHRLLQLADLVLEHATVEHRAGDVEVHGFVLSLSWLFEKLVGKIFTETSSSVRVHEQARFALDAGAELTIKPDFVFLAGLKVVAVADTKYKILDDKGKFPNADAYQLVTYCARLGLSAGHLIYAAGEACPVPFEILGAGCRLVVHAVDLTKDVASIERQLLELFDQITMSRMPLEETTAERRS